MSARQDHLRPDEQADLVLRCAYLVAVGDAHLAEEESSHLSLVRGQIHRMLSARSAIEAVERGQDFVTARRLFDPSTPVELRIEGVLGLPPALIELHQLRQDVATQEDLRALEEGQAHEITDPFLQKVAYFFCIQVASADDDLSDAEHQTLRILAGEWGLSHESAVDWYNNVAFSVLTGEGPKSDQRANGGQTDDGSEEETAAELRRLLGLDDLPTDPDS